MLYTEQPTIKPVLEFKPLCSMRNYFLVNADEINEGTSFALAEVLLIYMFNR